MTADDRWLVLRRAGVQVVLDTSGPRLPRVNYWGADLGDLDATECAALPSAGHDDWDQLGADLVPGPFSLSPTRALAWPGWPGLTGHRNGLASQPLFAVTDVSADDLDGADVVRYRGVDAAVALQLDGEFRLTADGVLMCRQTLTSIAAPEEPAYQVEDLLTLLPVPQHVTELLDHGGHWGNEAQQQRVTLGQGTWLREQRRGRTGPDSPLLLSVGTAGFGYRHGELWGIHLGWSGDQRYLAQRQNTGVTLIGAGEILGAGEVMLAAGEAITTPWAYGVWSDRGLDGASARLHAMLRRRPTHPTRVRPIVLNTWEAVYFDQSYERLAALADVAADIGVERFVIDDGWFGSRRDDTSGLGDWFVAPQIWPQGLGQIAEYVRGKGMELGLWFEPEMVNLDSDVARAHPDWVLGTPGRMGPPFRHQQVLDVSHPDAHAYLLNAISSLIAQCGIAYLKWDHNRDLADPVHRGGPRAGMPAVREQTLAAYRLMDELKQRHPGLEIESCSSGGSRVDYGVLERTDRVWASDCIDPLERVSIVPGIATIVPLELIGSHVASGRSHTTSRVHDLAFRLSVALFGHAGLEWDLTTTSAQERAELAEWVRFAKQVRSLLHSGELVRLDPIGDASISVYGVVALDKSQAIFNVVRTATSSRSGAAPVRFAGLDPQVRYRVQRATIPGEQMAAHHGRDRIGADGAHVRGAQLMTAGLLLDELLPEHAAVYLLHAT